MKVGTKKNESHENSKGRKKRKVFEFVRFVRIQKETTRMNAIFI